MTKRWCQKTKEWIKLHTKKILLVSGIVGITVAAGVSTIIQPSIIEQIQGKPAIERANIKADRLIELFSNETFVKNGYTIEMRDIEKINGGIQYYARVSKDDEKWGLGKDGSVEWERFRVYSPPVLIPDGTKREIVDEFGFHVQINNFIEDPIEALRLDLAHTIGIVAKDVRPQEGKVGRTTSTFYPDAHVESTSVDGDVSYSGNPSWDVTHDAATGITADDDDASRNAIVVGVSSSNYDIRRAFYLADASPIDDDDIVSSVTFSIYVNSTQNSDNDGNDWLNIVQSSPASDTAIITADYNQCGAVNNPIEGATRIDMSSLGTSAYNNWTLNATGTAWISKTDITKLGMREGHDALDDIYGGANNSYNLVNADYADKAGTTTDPKLVVVHAAEAAVAPRVPVNWW